VIQPQLPLRLPCYDFTPSSTLPSAAPSFTVRTPTSGIANFRGVTGGVYKARERIHRDVADSRLQQLRLHGGEFQPSNPNRDGFLGFAPLAGLQPFVPANVARL